MTKDEWYRQLFERLDNSKFRSSFHLKQKDIDYINERRGSAKNHIKEPKKRTNEDDERFAQSFEKLVLMAQAKEGEQNGTV